MTRVAFFEQEKNLLLIGILRLGRRTTNFSSELGVDKLFYSFSPLHLERISVRRVKCFELTFFCQEKKQVGYEVKPHL